MKHQIPDYFPPPDKRRIPDVPLIEAKLTAKKWTGTLSDKFISALVTLVSQSNLQSWVSDLSAFPTRHTKSPNINKIASWLVDKFKDFGYTDVILHPYTKDGYQLNNVICTKPGISNTGQIIVLCGHFDCIMENSNNISSNAPGADDNATGIASILEISRILSQVKLKDTVQFIAFSGEEQGYWGSIAYAKYAQANNINIHRLINLDQIGYPSTKSTIIIERDMGNRVASNDQASKEFGNVMAQMAANYTSLHVKFGEIYGSDYMPFEAGGYVVLGVYEGEGNPNYHSSNDLSITVDFRYVTEVTRMTLATILHETLALTARARDR